jgi:hypothetical protein
VVDDRTSYIDDKDRIVRIAAGRDHAAALTSAGRLFIWGSNLWTEPREITVLKDKKLIDVACGDRSTLVVAGKITLRHWTHHDMTCFDHG